MSHEHQLHPVFFRAQNFETIQALTTNSQTSSWNFSPLPENVGTVTGLDELHEAATSFEREFGLPSGTSTIFKFRFSDDRESSSPQIPGPRNLKEREIIDFFQNSMPSVVSFAVLARQDSAEFLASAPEYFGAPDLVTVEVKWFMKGGKAPDAAPGHLDFRGEQYKIKGVWTLGYMAASGCSALHFPGHHKREDRSVEIGNTTPIVYEPGTVTRYTPTSAHASPDFSESRFVLRAFMGQGLSQESDKDDSPNNAEMIDA